MSKLGLSFLAICTFCIVPLSVAASALRSESFTGHWEGNITREGKNWRVWVDVAAGESSTSGTADFPDYGLFAFPIQVTRHENQISISVLEGREVASFEGKLQGNQILGDWKGLGINATFQISRVSEKPLAPYVVEEVVIKNGDAILAGTLVSPRDSKRHPAIVFTHGSGNQTRSETFYRSRAYWFARNGIAALIYDRRGKGASKGDGKVTWENLADDAIAGAKYLQTRSEVNPLQVGVAGFSQGGWVSPLAAIRSKDVAFVLVGSTAAITPLEQNDYNVESVLRDKHVPLEKIRAVMELRGRVAKYQLSGRGDPDALNEEIAGLKKESWFPDTLLTGPVEKFDSDSKTYMEFNPAPVWEKVRVPILALWGEEDIAVPATKSREIIDHSLHAGNARTYDLREFPHAGHGLSINRGPSDPWDFPRLVIGYQELMVEWTKKMAERVE